MFPPKLDSSLIYVGTSQQISPCGDATQFITVLLVAISYTCDFIHQSASALLSSLYNAEIYDTSGCPPSTILLMS